MSTFATGGTVRNNKPASSTAKPAQPKPAQLGVEGRRSRRPAMIDNPMRTCSVRSDPAQATSSRLAPRAPTMAPKVLAEYTPAINLAASSPFDAAAASAKGKLAPQSSVGGNSAQNARARSSSKVNQMFEESEGLIGQ